MSINTPTQNYLSTYENAKANVDAMRQNMNFSVQKALATAKELEDMSDTSLLNAPDRSVTIRTNHKPIFIPIVALVGLVAIVILMIKLC